MAGVHTLPGIEVLSKRVRLEDYSFCFEFETDDEASEAATYLERFAIPKVYRDRYSVTHIKGSKRVCVTLSPQAHMNLYPYNHVNDVLYRIYYALSKMYLD